MVLNLSELKTFQINHLQIKGNLNKYIFNNLGKLNLGMST